MTLHQQTAPYLKYQTWFRDNPSYSTQIPDLARFLIHFLINRTVYKPQAKIGPRDGKLLKNIFVDIYKLPLYIINYVHIIF